MSSSETGSELTKSEAKLMSDSTNSTEPSKDQRSGSVYDFLYHDARRIASFLSQFEVFGNPQSVIATREDAKGETRATSGEAEGGVSGILQGRASLNVATSSETRGTAEWTYDPFWRNAITLLDYLVEKNLLVQELGKARIGQFVLASGRLSILDLVMMQKAWKLPGIQKAIRHGAESGLNRQQRRAAEKIRDQSQGITIDLFIELLSVFPHSVQIKLANTDGEVWSSLEESSIVGLSTDLILKHGINIPGEWNILGILDALPERGEEDIQATEGSTAAGSHVGNLVLALAPLVQSFLGRPAPAFGVTTLLVFRKVQ